MPDINDLRQQRDSHATEARRLLDTAEQAGRSLTGEEEQTFDRHMEKVDEIDGQIEREDKLRRAEKQAAETDPPKEGGRQTGEPESADEVVARAWRKFLRDGFNELTSGERDGLVAGKEPEGGYLAAPQQFVEQLIQEVDDEVPLRGLATGQTLTEGESLGVPTLDTDLNDAEWTAEIKTGSQDDSLRFGKRELRPHPLAKRVLTSRTLLRRATIGPEAIVRARMAYKHAVAREKGYMTGDGNQKPLGLFIASSQGISTSRDVDVSTDGSNLVKNASGNAADDLIDAKYTLKPQYWRRARWLFHRDAIKGTRKLKDANDQYLWQPGLAGDRPDTILEVPFTVSEFAPNDFSDNSYIGLLGDFSYYWYVDALDMEMQRLEELYAETNQVGFIGRFEGDGMPVLEEPFVRLQANDVSA